jgi:methyl-accepting chemotaxis protein
MEASENVSDLTMEVSASTQEQVATFNELIEKIEQMNVSTNKVFDLTRDQVEQSKNITTSGSEINNMTFDLSVMSENVEMISEQIEAQAQALIQVMKQFKLEGSHDQE